MLAIFDLDGTLTDPYEGIARCAQHALASVGQPLLGESELRAFIGPPLQENFAGCVPAELVDASIAAYRERFDAIGWQENLVYDGVPQMLGTVRAAGSRIALATSKPAVFAKRILDHFGLDGYFNVVVGATLDGSLRHKPDLIARVLDETNVACGDAVMIGDRSHDILGAVANHVRAVGAGWGYAEPGELDAAGAEYIAATPADVSAYLG